MLQPSIVLVRSIRPNEYKSLLQYAAQSSIWHEMCDALHADKPTNPGMEESHLAVYATNMFTAVTRGLAVEIRGRESE